MIINRRICYNAFYRCIVNDVQRNIILGRYKLSYPLVVRTISSSTNDAELQPHVTCDGETNKDVLHYKHAEKHEREINQLFIYAKNRRMRYRKSLIMLEGKRQIQDALDAKLTLKLLMFNRVELVNDFDLPMQCYNEFKTPLYKARYDFIQMWSDLTTSPGLIGLFDMPVILRNATPVGAAPITIVCDNIREPGNLGSILRIASAIPVSKVILTKGCVDLWDTKVVRSSCGSHFKMPIFYGVNWDEINEENDGYVFLADCSWFSESGDELKKRDFTTTAVPIVPYHCVRYNKLSPIIVIIGGETEGLSNESLDFACKRKGIRINIPLSNYVDSLNSGVALGVILFEMKRNLLNSDN